MKKSYIDYKFLGVHSFISTLDSSDTEYRLFDDDFSALFSRHSEILSSGDTITAGMITREGQQAYFTEIGIKITKSFRSFFVYFFDHHPTMEDMDSIVVGLESAISENLDKIDPSEISRALQDQQDSGTVH